MIVALTVSVSACTSNDQRMARWVGKHRDDLIQYVGAPNHEAVLSNGGRTLTYLTPWSDGYTAGECRQAWTTDQAGIIRTWSYSGCSRW
jgi:hypothetical protein